MPKISNQKKDRIKEQILSHLYSSFPKPIFTSDIAKEIARDEEFVKKLMKELSKNELVLEIGKNPKGIRYKRRMRWKLSNKVQQAYKKQLS